MMNTLHFKYAVEVERTRSISQAADNLSMAQPNLSKAIKELEETLSFTVFERTSKGVFPTPKGKEFLIYAKNILTQLDKVDALAKPELINTQHFNISIPRGSYIANGFTNFVSELDTTKGIHIKVQETNSMQAIQNITDGPFNLGIIRYQQLYESYFVDYLETKNLYYEPIWEFEYLALMSEKHSLAKAKKINSRQLYNFIEITHGDTTVPYLSLNKKIDEDELLSKKIYVYERSNQFDLLSSIHTTFMWASPVPDRFLKRYGLVLRKCQDSKPLFKDLLIYHKKYNFSDLDQKFIQKLIESKDQLVGKKYS